MTENSGRRTSQVAVLRPAVTARISKETTGGQGAATGLANCCASLGRMVGPIWAGVLFDVNYHYPFASGAAILFAGLLISLRWVSETPKAAARVTADNRLAELPNQV